MTSRKINRWRESFLVEPKDFCLVVIVMPAKKQTRPRKTAEEKAEILQYALSHTVKDTAEKFGVSAVAINQWKAKAGQTATRGGSKPKEDYDIRLVKLLGAKGVDAKITVEITASGESRKMVIGGVAGKINWVFDSAKLDDNTALLTIGNQATVTVTLDKFLSMLKTAK